MKNCEVWAKEERSRRRERLKQDLLACTHSQSSKPSHMYVCMYSPRRTSLPRGAIIPRELDVFGLLSGGVS